MNYISQIRAFYDVLSVKQLSAGQIALWHALMDKCNRCGWPEWFTVANIMLESSCSLSRKGIFDSRNSLKQAGLINFRSNGTKATSYHIITLYSTQDSTQATTQDSTQATTQVSATLLKPKTDKQKHKDLSISPQGDDDRFLSFWAAYPRKVAKGDARKAWGKIRPSAKLHAAMLAAIETQKQSDQWQRDGGQFIPYPATWLNQARWEDEPTGGTGIANGTRRDDGKVFYDGKWVTV